MKNATLICVCTYDIIQIENKTTAVQGSANSHAPAQVESAPTQRDYPAPQGYYIRFATILQEGTYLGEVRPGYHTMICTV